jgi:hypothetical protein
MTEDEEKYVTTAMLWYLPLMHEVRLRLDLVKAACDGDLQLEPPFAREYAYLQFRRVCELIALGCLKLHGDLPETQSKAAKKAWHADEIMKLLRRNSSHAFPQSVTRTQTDNGEYLQANSKPNALSFEEFSQLYNECGKVLHRGTIKMLESNGPLTVADYQKILMWQSKLIDLLNEHVVTRPENRGMFLTSLKVDTGYPACSHFKHDGNGRLEVITRNMTAPQNAASGSSMPLSSITDYIATSMSPDIDV